jgi:hypothetical protein
MPSIGSAITNSCHPASSLAAFLWNVT